ncbi:MAG: ATP-binding protein [Evtepia gabavorous]
MSPPGRSGGCPLTRPGGLPRLQGDYDAIEVAMEALKEADDQLHARFSPQLSQTAAGYFQQLTQGRFSQVALDRSFNVTVRETGALADRPLALLSQGTADQLYLALRLAVADLVLPSPQACPLILDDALLSFDDDRLAVVLHLLTELAEDRQILLFTCQHREFFMLEDRPEITTVTLPDF